MKSRPRTDDKTFDAAMRLGAAIGFFAVAEHVSKHVNAAAIRALSHFAETGGYVALGFNSFDEFLSKSPHAPITRGQYYERKALLDKEGDPTFDVLNALGVPATARKVTAGSVRLEGDVIVIGDSHVCASDRAAVLEAVRTLAAQLKAGRERIERGDQELKALKVKAERGSLAGRLNSNPHDDALNLALVALKALTIEARKLNPDETAAVRDDAARQIGAALGGAREAYRL